MNFNHFDEQGHAVMVDVSSKQETMRTATAAADVIMSAELLAAIAQKSVSKGDVLGVARLAGIMAAKKTDDLIPLSHPLSLHSVSIEFDQDPATCRIQARCTVRAFERTGVEMEAMTGAAVAALTIYDMCKGTDKSISIANIRLLYKEGGKSGLYRREEAA
ncbi:cyclic pyranopterin monophosphate synthase MoaC [Trichlorobacter lovleyi]|uniref:cyclic pyranopterin monophosphate synthase MoaC n=1 Tax=Trichlorobacter lovleyi TaxID=313985 RepID=UPI00223F3EBB|nr:cyclic pyranopterin monophosphate synthase MoaC [Trichlorobacter lovleyi]QOX78083.1 cyclic pyranopterin monophosphate synthase MoaC [Trichlorobacter lovleyi]